MHMEILEVKWGKSQDTGLARRLTSLPAIPYVIREKTGTETTAGSCNSETILVNIVDILSFCSLEMGRNPHLHPAHTNSPLLVPLTQCNHMDHALRRRIWPRGLYSDLQFL